MIYATIRQHSFSNKFKLLLFFIKGRGLDVNKNFEKFRNLFSQNFEILQPYGWIFLDLGFEWDPEDSTTISSDTHQPI